MPLYDYKCHLCGKTFEVRQHFADAVLTLHEDCGGELERLISLPALQFKGTGFYITDYGRDGKSPSNAPHGASESKSESKGESKSESKSESKGESKNESRGESKTGTKSESGGGSKSESKTESKPAPAVSTSDK
jgi:putative FmdB family regulatory protein